MPLVSTSVGEHVKMSFFVGSITTQKFNKHDSSSITTSLTNVDSSMTTHLFIVRRLHAAVGILRTFRPPCFYRGSSMSTWRESSTLAQMFSLLPVPNHNYLGVAQIE